MKVIGLDLGFGQTKVFSEKGAMKFPSWLAYWASSGLEDLQTVEYQGITYVVGEQAKFGKRIELAGIDELIKYYPVFIKHAAELLEYQTKETLVITGLPPRYMDRAGYIREEKGGPKRYTLFQGFGVYWDIKEQVQSGLIIDIGFNTVDYFAFSDANNKLVREAVGTMTSLGVINAVGIFRDLLPSQHEILKNKSLSALVDIFTAGKFRGYDFSQIKEQAIERWNEMMKARLRQEIGVLFEEKQELVVAGGGAYLIKPDVFSQAVVIPEAPEFSNARGYYKFGLSLI